MVGVRFEVASSWVACLPLLSTLGCYEARAPVVADDEACDLDDDWHWEIGVVDLWRGYLSNSAPVVDDEGTPHFLAADWYSGVDHATTAGGRWHKERVSDLRYINETAIAVSPEGVVHAVLVQYANESVADPTWAAVHWARRRAGVWDVEPIPVPESRQAGGPILELDANGEPIVLVRLAAPGSDTVGRWTLLRHEQAGWSVEEVPNSATMHASGEAVTFDDAGEPHFARYDSPNGGGTLSLSYRRRVSDEWVSELVDSSTDGNTDSQAPAVTLTPGGSVRFAYHDVDAVGRATFGAAGIRVTSTPRPADVELYGSALALERAHDVVHEAGRQISGLDGSGLYYARLRDGVGDSELVAPYETGASFTPAMTLGPSCCGAARTRPFILWFQQPDLVWAMPRCR